MLIRRFIKGRNVTDSSVIEFHKENGKLIKFHYGNGGGGKVEVFNIPDEIKGYIRQHVKPATRC